MSDGAGAIRRRAVEETAKQVEEAVKQPDVLCHDYGQVEVTRSVTVQVKQYHPVVTSVALRLPIEKGETPEEAIGRVMAVVDESLDPAVTKVVQEGFKW